MFLLVKGKGDGTHAIKIHDGNKPKTGIWSYNETKRKKRVCRILVIFQIQYAISTFGERLPVNKRLKSKKSKWPP